MSSTLQYTAHINELSEVDLRQLLLLRQVDKQHNTALNLASTLLQAKNIRQVLNQLTNIDLELLRTDKSSALLESAGLTMKGAVPPEVIAAIPNFVFNLEPETKTTTLKNTEWYPQASAEILRVMFVLDYISKTIVESGKRTNIAPTASRELVEMTGWNLQQLHTVCQLLMDSGMILSVQDRVVITTVGDLWLKMSMADKWVHYVASIISAVPLLVRYGISKILQQKFAAFTPTTTEILREFPLLTDKDCGAFSGILEAWNRCGLYDIPDLAEIITLADSPNTLHKIACDAFPKTVSGVYLQPDMSIIIPGLLAENEQRFLWQIASPKHIGIAQNLEITQAKIQDALRTMSVSSITEKIEKISLTGFPQPLTYLLNQLSDTSQSLTVTEQTGNEFRSSVTAPADIANQILVDSNLRGLKITQTGETTDFKTLSSPISRATLEAALQTAGYLVTTETAVQNVSELANIDIQPDTTVQDTLTAILSNQESHSFQSLLELAAKEQTQMLITAESNGKTHIFKLRPLAVAHGRLRGIDLASEMERTIPLTAITSAEPLTQL